MGAHPQSLPLNRQAGKGWVRVSPILWEVLNEVLAAARMSEGLVTPTVLPAMEMVGYDRDFAQIRDGGAITAPVDAPPVSDWRALRLDPSRRAVMLPTEMRLDLGGIAKGWAAEKAAQRLAARGPALVDAGGDIAVRGARVSGEPWAIGVNDPFHPDEYLDILLLSGGGVATSGRDARHWRQGDVERHHIFLGFAVFALALVHGLWSGSDSASDLARAIYWASGGSVLFLTVYRVLAAKVKVER